MAKRHLDNDENKRYFLNPDAVSIHLYCSICQEVFDCPQRAPCGHSYCKKCILAWLKQSRTCPEDRRPLQTKDLHHDFIVENVIGDQKVACKFRKLGCMHVGQLSHSASHIRECSFNPDNLPDFLRTDVEKDQLRTSHDTSHTESDSETVPTPGKPSLKMRLFQAGGESRDLLCSVFDAKSQTAAITPPCTSTNSTASILREKSSRLNTFLQLV